MGEVVKYMLFNFLFDEIQSFNFVDRLSLLNFFA